MYARGNSSGEDSARMTVCRFRVLSLFSCSEPDALHGRLPFPSGVLS